MQFFFQFTDSKARDESLLRSWQQQQHRIGSERWNVKRRRARRNAMRRKEMPLVKATTSRIVRRNTTDGEFFDLKSPRFSLGDLIIS